VALYPSEGGAVSSLPDVFDECTVARVHDLSEGILALLANSNIFFDIDMSLRLQQCFGGRKRTGEWRRGRGRQAQFNNEGMQ